MPRLWTLSTVRTCISRYTPEQLNQARLMGETEPFIGRILTIRPISCLILIGDLPMSRVKFGTKHEYEYLANYKVLQNCFISHKVDKVKKEGNQPRGWIPMQDDTEVFFGGRIAAPKSVTRSSFCQQQLLTTSCDVVLLSFIHVFYIC